MSGEKVLPGSLADRMLRQRRPGPDRLRRLARHRHCQDGPRDPASLEVAANQIGHLRAARTTHLRRAKACAEGRVRAAGVERDVVFEETAPSVNADLHAAYHAKYDRYGPRMVATVVSPEAARTTLRLVPRETELAQ